MGMKQKIFLIDQRAPCPVFGNLTPGEKMAKKGSVLIVGGGIGGMQAALDLADSGYYVYLVEKSPSIGGVMAQLDKTFPTNDCAM
jgi:heterodisulfide reductase subunit A